MSSRVVDNVRTYLSSLSMETGPVNFMQTLRNMMSLLTLRSKYNMPSYVVSPDFTMDYLAELTVSQNTSSESGAGPTISDADGNVLFMGDGHGLGTRDRCALLDRQGNPILSARKRLMAHGETWQVATGGDFQDKNLIFSVNRISSEKFKTYLPVHLNALDEAPDFYVEGNFISKEVDVYFKDRHLRIAELKRKRSAGGALLDKHTFTLRVEPKVDQAFIATLIIIMDCIYEE